MDKINKNRRILLLEDDRLYCDTLEDYLSEIGYDVDSVYDPYSALEYGYKTRYDLYLFDVNLPFESGFELLHKLRDADDYTPTIFITSREDRESLLDGFEAGADDYLRKPIDLAELSARIEAVLRRRIGKSRIVVGGYELDTLSKRLWRDGHEIKLSNRLFDLLLMLISADGEVVSTEQIMLELWPRDRESSYGALRVYIVRLKKLFGSRIQNIRGVGYRWADDDTI